MLPLIIDDVIEQLMGRYFQFFLLHSSILFILSCNSNINEEPATGGSSGKSPTEDKYVNGLRYHLTYNGTIDTINDNSWLFTSHTRPGCKNKETEPCRKIDINYPDDNYSPERITHHTFEFEIVELNTEEPPPFVIIFQDWVRIYPKDKDGNRPISTLKIENENGQLFLRHYDNSWQWTSPPLVGNPEGSPPNYLNGQYPIEVGVSYDIDFTIYDYGRASLTVNGKLVSDALYQTKSPTEKHAIQWGMYWAKGYNKENAIEKRIVFRFDNFSYPAVSKSS